MERRRLHIVGRLKRSLSRLRHRRGHGVHSPYIYNIVREVFMHRNKVIWGTPMRDTLESLGVNRGDVVELDNLRHHCGFSSFGVDSVEPLDMVICSVDASFELTLKIVHEAKSSGTTVVILSPYLDAHRGAMCDYIISSHGSTTVNRRGYLIVFNNHLPKQHFVL